jgi:predicted RNase H-like HicB family nuclease
VANKSTSRESLWSETERPEEDDVITTILTAIFFDDDDGVTGFVEECLSVSVHGKDLNEARAKLKKAAREFLEGNGVNVSERLAAYGAVLRERLTVKFKTEA